MNYYYFIYDAYTLAPLRRAFPIKMCITHNEPSERTSHIVVRLSCRLRAQIIIKWYHHRHRIEMARRKAKQREKLTQTH